MTRSCLARRAGTKHVLLTLQGQFQNLTSGQGQVMTEVGQYADHPKRLDEPSRLAPFVRLCLHPVASYWRKLDFDLI